MDIPQQSGHSKAEVGGMINIHEFAKIAANQAIKAGADRPEQLNDLAERTREAKAALLEAVKGVGNALDSFEPTSNEYLRSVRAFRMTAIAETASCRTALEDIRKFLIGPDHAKEIAALKEFVDLCERLQKLKESGFLDAVADTILKLA